MVGESGQFVLHNPVVAEAGVELLGGRRHAGTILVNLLLRSGGGLLCSWGGGAGC